MAKKAKKNALLGGVHPAVISVWAALIAAAHLLPAIVLVGTGGTMSVSAILVPLAGVLFGPVAGTLVGAIGQFIGFLIAPAGAWLGMFTFLIGTCTALTTGLASRGKGPYALILSGLGIVLWMTQEIGRKAWIFGAVFGGYGFVCLLITCFIGKKCLMSKNLVKKGISIFLCCVGGMCTSGMLANFSSLVLFKTPAITWKVLVAVSPVERTIFAVAAVIIGIPLLVGLPKVGIFVGPQPEDVDEEEDEDMEEEVK